MKNVNQFLCDCLNQEFLDESQTIKLEDVRKMLLDYSIMAQNKQIECCADFAASYYLLENGASYSLCQKIHSHIKNSIKVVNNINGIKII